MPWQQAERRARYLNKVRGLCFNCLSRGHKVAFCVNQTRCWFCRCSGHISTECPSHKGSKPTISSRSMVPGPDHHTCPPHNQPCSYLDQSLELMLPPKKLEAAKESRIDPMCEEAELMLLPRIKKSFIQSVPIRSTAENESQELFKVAPQLMLATPARMKLEQKAEIAGEENSVRRSRRLATIQKQVGIKGIEEYLPHPNTMQEGSFPMADIVGIQTHLQMRSGAEQRIEHKLIKALRSSNQNVVTPLSPSTLCNMSSEKENVFGSKKDNQRRCSQKLKSKIKSQKSNIKVVRNMLTRKWRVVKTHKKLGVSSSKQYLHTYKKPLSTSNIEAVKQVAEMVIFMHSLRKLIEATKKKREEKKRTSDR